MRWPSLESLVLAAGLLAIGGVNLAFNPEVVPRVGAQYEGDCDPTEAPCCENGDPVCVSGVWYCP
jgi:hypothetical protein